MYTTESVTHGQSTPDLRLPPQPQSITAVWPVPIYTAWWTEAHLCEQLAHGRYVKRSGRDSNLRPIGCKSGALTIKLTVYVDVTSKFVYRKQKCIELAKCCQKLILIKYCHKKREGYEGDCWRSSPIIINNKHSQLWSFCSGRSMTSERSTDNLVVEENEKLFEQKYNIISITCCWFWV